MKKLALLSLILSLFLATVTTASEADLTISTPKITPHYNVFDGIEQKIDQDYSISIFKEILATADLEDMIKYDAANSGFTLFIPTDQSLINGLTRERCQELVTNKGAARYFVMFHMIQGKKSASELITLSGKEVMSMSQTPLLFTAATSNITGKRHLIINGAIDLAGPYESTNNLSIYIIDTPITP